MKILRHIALNATSRQIEELRALGISPRVVPNTTLPGGTRPPLVEFDMEDTNAVAQAVLVMMEQWGESLGTVRTVFTPLEIESARQLQLTAWLNGFPQPQDFEAFTRITYDLTNTCSKCAHGLVQNAPFRIKIEPKWNRRGIMSLHWAHDEFFVPPAVWEMVFKPFGITCRPVANRKGVELQTVVQLVVEEEVAVVTDGLTPIHCAACGRDRYQWVTRGMFSRLAEEPSAAMSKSQQLFGDGWGAHAVFVSQELVRAMKAHNIRGAEFTPVDAALPALVA